MSDSTPSEPPKLDEVIPKPRKRWISSCHCNAHRFTVSVPEPLEVWDCNCSLCQKEGALWCFAYLKTTDLKWTKGGEDSLSTYIYFHKEDGRYFKVQFCPHCGTLMYERRISPGKDVVQGGLNARALRGIDVWSLDRQFNDDKDKGTPYVPTKPSDIEFKMVEDGLQVYDGSCHCGAVTFKVKTQALEEQIALDCNCSICVRNGYLWIYPPPDAVLVSPSSLEFLAGYCPIPNGVRSHKFCKRCGASVFNFMDEPISGKPIKRSVNVRCIDGVDSFLIKTKKYDGWGTREPQYNPE